MRGARLRSASPFLDNTSASTSAGASQQSSQASSPAKISPSKNTRSSPRKKTSVASASLQPLTRRSTRSRSRSVDPDSLPVIDEDDSAPVTSIAGAITEAETTESSASESNSKAEQEVTSSEPRLASLSEDAAVPTSPETIDAAEQSSSNSSSDSDTGSDSDPGSDSDSNSDDASSASSSEDDEVGDSTADLDALLKASQQAYKNRTPASAARSRFEDNQDVIAFDGALNDASSSKRSGKAIPLVVKAKHQMEKSQPIAAKQSSSSKYKIDQQIEALDQAPPAADKKKSKHARTVQTSTGSSWFDMPEFGASASRLAALKKQSAADSGHSKVTGGDARLASAEQLRREVQALRLRNALDPKRFYRASAKNQAMPKFAQLGKIIASPLEPKAVLSRQERGRTVVEELIRDAEAASYAKRKFSESQASHRSNYNGRRKPPSKKKRA